MCAVFHIVPARCALSVMRVTSSSRMHSALVARREGQERDACERAALRRIDNLDVGFRTALERVQHRKHYVIVMPEASA